MPTGETSCLCTVCLKAFPCEHWHYVALVSIREARALPVEDLLARTNPGLAERRELNEQISALGGDTEFAVSLISSSRKCARCIALAVVEAVARPGPAAQEQNSLLSQRIVEQAPGLALRSTGQERVPVSPWLPDRAASALVAGSAFLWIPASPNWLGAGITAGTGFAAAASPTACSQCRTTSHGPRTILFTAKIVIETVLFTAQRQPGSQPFGLHAVQLARVAVDHGQTQECRRKKSGVNKSIDFRPFSIYPAVAIELILRVPRIEAFAHANAIKNAAISFLEHGKVDGKAPEVSAQLSPNILARTRRCSSGETLAQILIIISLQMVSSHGSGPLLIAMLATVGGSSGCCTPRRSANCFRTSEFQTAFAILPTNSKAPRASDKGSCLGGWREKKPGRWPARNRWCLRRAASR